MKRFFITSIISVLSVVFGTSSLASTEQTANTVKEAREQRPAHLRKPHPGAYTNDIIKYFGGVPVVTSPYLGTRSEFDGSDLIVNFSSINQDVALLKQFKALQLELIRSGLPLPEHPLVDLSGKIVGFGFYSSPFAGRDLNGLDLLSAELDTAISINPWVSGLLTLKYDNARPRFGGQRTANSRLFVNNGFITVGNLRLCPTYFTVGQLYVPFGVYSSNLISSTFPSLLGKTQARSAVLGYRNDGANSLYGAVYYFQGDTRVAGQNVGGVNGGFELNRGQFKAVLGAGVISNMAEAVAIQRTGGNIFPGFGVSNVTEVMVHRVPAFNANGKLSYKQFFLKGEYVGATRSFDPLDVSFNGHGARPWAYHIEGGMNFSIKDKPAALAAAYAQTGEAYALNLPRRAFFAVFSMVPWRDTNIAIEYRHDYNYPRGTTASGRGGIVNPSAAPLGRTADTVSASFGIYF